ncbi:polysaccharide biosynthesis protein [Comamonas flocculans]|uniref:Polysaccharide biosynthesis protein n=1 Tax=Comamonas flocculans TaxID=2597701 RepID=A0A5B8RUP8_9BURK|nr:nucleoside-diphosphate sugar epimerase/dehydratase [Comamonas flocculans]QEA13276.1 polysaccharide biosynthesis protein [Comamonas flocculans]
MSLDRALAPLLFWPRRAKQLLVLFVDLLTALVAVWLAFFLRLDQFSLPVQQQALVYPAALLFVPVFIRMGLYRAVFRYTGLAALLTIALAVAVYGLIFFGLLLSMQWQGVPRSVGLIQPVLFLVLAGGWRVLARSALLSASAAGKPALLKGRLLIYGAGDAGAQTAFALGVAREYQVCGFVDDDPNKVGRSINRVPIIAPADVAGFVARHGIGDVLLAIPSLSRERRREIIKSLQHLQVHVRSLPGLKDLAEGKVSITDFQELDIEDLLGRTPVPPDKALLTDSLLGRVVLVTGAGGSIGSELCRQIVLQRPLQLVLVEHNEFGLYSIHQELLALCRKHGLDVVLMPELASIRSLRRLRAVFALYRPQVVYHAAAYKHVPLVQGNPAEGILNNVFGTLNLARAALEVGAAQCVLISTDKAVRPTNVMGASKRVAEMVLQALADIRMVDFSAVDDRAAPPPVANHTRIAMVRFGNVLGSSGSVVPLFRRQLREGGPLTVTHAEVTRYFMTIPEAAQLVLQAGAMGKEGEVFVLDMGEPVKIMDLARRMVMLSGMTVRDEAHPAGDIAIQIVGLRPGEKLYEELLIGDNPESTSHPRIMKAHEAFLPWDELVPVLVRLRSAAVSGNAEVIHALLGQLVSGYRH